MPLLPTNCKKYIEQKDIGNLYKGITFDGCFFYITCPKTRRIYKFNKQFVKVDCFKTTMAYSRICYDIYDECFWATDSSLGNTVFKLDNKFNLISDIDIDFKDAHENKITGLAYNCATGSLIVTFSNRLISVDTRDNSIEVIKKFNKSIIKGVCSISPTLLVTYIKDDGQSISIYDSSLKEIYNFEVPNNYIVESIVFDPCEEFHNNKFTFYVLCTKGGCLSCVCKWVLDDKNANASIDFCNYEICRNKYGKPDIDIYDKETYKNILKSTALIENSIAYDLKSEVQKFQELISDNDDSNKIMYANIILNDTISKIYELEAMINEKLKNID